jgi:hypothetical protein
MTHLLKGRVAALLALAAVAALSSCSGSEEPRGPGPVEPPDLCAQVACGPGRCAVINGHAACQCDPGHHAEGLTCVKDETPPPNPCQPNPCVEPHKGQCSAVDGGAVCACEPDWREVDGGACEVPHPCSPNPCTAPFQTECAAVDGRAVCSCVAGYVPAGEGCQPEVVITCAGQHSTGDALEPDECPALARDLGTSGTQHEAHTVAPVGDEDWLRFEATEGHIYEVRLDAAEGVRPHVDVYSADGQTVCASDHEGTATVRLAYEASVTGRQYVRVRAFDGTGGAYRVSLADLGPDDYGDEVATATPVDFTSGTPVAGTLQPAGDRDVARVPLAGGRRYRVEAAWGDAARREPLRLAVLEGSGSEVGSDQGTAPRVALGLSGARDVYVRVSEVSGRARGDFSFTVTDLGADDHGDHRGEATHIGPGRGPEEGHLEREGDVDALTFSGEAGRVHAFTCNPGQGLTACDVSLTDARGQVLATDANGGSAYVARELDAAGEYTLLVSSGGVGTYTWRLEDLGPDDHGDTRASATRLTAGAPRATGRLETPGDVDVFSFEGVAEEVFEFTCTGSSVDCEAELVDAEGRVLAEDTAGGVTERIRYRLPGEGTYFLQVRSGPAAVGSYGYALVSLGTDEHGDTPDTATPVEVGAPEAPGRIDTEEDVDVFSFTARAGHIYEFSCGAEGVDCNAELLDAAGRVVAQDTALTLTATLAYEMGAGGTYYVRVSGGGGTRGTYSYALRDLGVDDHGDAPGSATALLLPHGGSTGRVELVGDVDVFSFPAGARHFYTFTCAGGAADCNVQVLDAGGQQVAMDGRSASTAEVTFKAGAAGTWYVRVWFGPGATARRGDYSYQLRELGVDDHGDSRDSATPLAPSSTATAGALEAAGDVDFFSFSGAASTKYEFTCLGATGVDCNVTLYDPSGMVLLEDTTSSTTARVVWVVRSAGTYFARVSHGTGGTGAYTWQLRDLGPDDHGNSLSSATLIEPSDTHVPARIDAVGDIDVFRFTAQAGHIYRFECNTTAFNCNVFLVILENGAVRTLASDTRGNLSASVTYEVATAGTYYFTVEPPTGAGAYTYRLQDLGVDDHGETRATSTPIAPSATAVGARLELAGDTDMFRFEAEAGHVYRFDCSPGTGLDCNAYAYNPDGTQLEADESSADTAVLRFKTSASGTYYLKVQSYFTDGFGAYTYQLRDLGLDDHGETRATSTPISPSSMAAAGSIQFPGDADMFRFEAEAGHVYRFDCVSAGALDCDAFAYNPDGTLLEADESSADNAVLRFKTSVSGTYYLKVDSYLVEGIGGYTYQLQDLGPDDHGDTRATSTPIQPSATAGTGSLEHPGDADMFRFEAEAGHVYRFDCTPGTGLDCDAFAYNPDGTQLVADTSSANTATLRFKAPSSGTYYLKVAPYLAGSFGGYTYQLQDLGLEDHADGFTGATPVVTGTPVSGRIEVVGDVDFFAVSLAGSTAYTVTATGLSLRITVYGPDRSTVLATGDGSRAFTSVAAGGAHYVRVTASTLGNTGAYSLTVQ